MNNTKKRTLAIVVLMLTAATLLVGAAGTLTTTTGQPAYAYNKKDNGNGNGNGNTITIQKCKQTATQSGFDNNQQQECENLICNHPGNNATCVQEGVTSTATPTPTPTTIQVSGQGEGQNFCPRATASRPASITFSAQQSGSAAPQGKFEITVQAEAGPFTKTSTLNGLQISGNTFTLTGTELSQVGASFCGTSQLPTSATITGQCGTGVTIQFTPADGEHATFTGNVACTSA